MIERVLASENCGENIKQILSQNIEQSKEEVKDTFSLEVKNALLRGDKPERVNELRSPLVLSIQDVATIAKWMEENQNLIHSYMQSLRESEKSVQ